MADKDLQQNWRVVSQYLRGSAYRNADTIKQLKEIYFGKKPLGKFARSYIALILSPEINESVLCEIEEAQLNDGDKDSLYRNLQDLQKSHMYYFGNNSLFKRDEKKIFDYFRFVETEDFKERFSERYTGSYRGVKKNRSANIWTLAGSEDI